MRGLLRFMLALVRGMVNVLAGEDSGAGGASTVDMPTATRGRANAQVGVNMAALISRETVEELPPHLALQVFAPDAAAAKEAFIESKGDVAGLCPPGLDMTPGLPKDVAALLKRLAADCSAKCADVKQSLKTTALPPNGLGDTCAPQPPVAPEADKLPCYEASGGEGAPVASSNLVPWPLSCLCPEDVAGPHPANSRDACSIARSLELS